MAHNWQNDILYTSTSGILEPKAVEFDKAAYLEKLQKFPCGYAEHERFYIQVGFNKVQCLACQGPVFVVHHQSPEEYNTAKKEWASNLYKSLTKKHKKPKMPSPYGMPAPGLAPKELDDEDEL